MAAGMWRTVVLLLTAAVWREVCGAESALYDARHPGIHILEKGTVAAALYNSSSAWLLEFYSSWCGHCISYAPTWRSLAEDVQDWHPAIKIGVLNCANEENTAICKDYGVQFYPTFRFFGAFTREFTQGENYKDSNREVQTVRQVIIDYLQSSGEHQPRPLPSLQPIGPADITALLNKPESHYTAIIVEDERSYIGREVILDLMQYENIVVRRAVNWEKMVLETLSIVSVPSCYLIYPNGTHGLINIVKPLRSVFSSHLKSLPSVQKKAGARSDYPARLGPADPKQDVVWRHYDKSKLYAADLESGLHYLLRVELATHQSLEGEKLKTFKDFITILYKLFPGRPHVVKLLETLQEWLVSMPLDKIPYDAILDIVNNKMRISGIFLTNRTQWVSCQGSQPQLRGYPCALWKLFHSLSMQAATQPGALANTAFEDDPPVVLKIMRRYIREFFGCRECAQHFEAMAKESESVKTAEEAVLWLWRKHNVVNNRLAGAPSEDPKSPKVQWPTPDLCPACHEEVNGIHSWNEKEVFSFLSRHYGSKYLSLQYADLNDDWHDNADRKIEKPHTKTPGDHHDFGVHKLRKPKPEFLDKVIQHQPDRDKKVDAYHEGNKSSISFLGLGFSSIDMSLCVVLYITSSLFLMIMYFFFKVRSRRWKIRYNRPFV
ncbi:sulfhydryl oxidase 2 [Hyperolius riggenbachi]|uniref:sulfhydryl oxidase 2 n=1 Tax=Hyperolius riggenbachi TaxID=752182 RepID=UPI0035A391DC